MSVCVIRISAWKPTSRSSCLPSRAPSSSTSITRSTWYVTTATRQPAEMLPISTQIKTRSNSLPIITSLAIFLCCLQKREKRKEEEQRRKQWVDQEREKTLSRLRSFREVRVSHCFCSASPCSLFCFFC